MNLRNLLIIASALGLSAIAQAESVKVDTLRYVGPYMVRQPLMIDSTDVKSNKFDAKKLPDAPLRLDLVEEGSVLADGIVASGGDQCALHLLGFSVSNKERAEVKISVMGLAEKRIYVDGSPLSNHDGKITLEPSAHKVVVKYLTMPEQIDTIKVEVKSEDDKALAISDIVDNERFYTIYDVLHATRFSGVSLSPNGKYMIYGKRFTRQGGQASAATYVRELSSGRIVYERSGGLTWMPHTNKYY